jgi:hypothetical protein
VFCHGSSAKAKQDAMVKETTRSERVIELTGKIGSKDTVVETDSREETNQFYNTIQRI